MMFIHFSNHRVIVVIVIIIILIVFVIQLHHDDAIHALYFLQRTAVKSAIRVKSSSYRSALEGCLLGCRKTDGD